MGATADGQEREVVSSHHAPSNEAVRKRNVTGTAPAAAAPAPKDAALDGPGSGVRTDEEMEKFIGELPHWTTQLSLRGFIFGAEAGCMSATAWFGSTFPHVFAVVCWGRFLGTARAARIPRLRPLNHKIMVQNVPLKLVMCLHAPS
jgi:hypothetical protein